MKPGFHRAMVCLLVASPARSRAGLEFCGYMSTAGELRFVIGDTESAQRSAWLSVGQSFQKHRIADFESKTETLILAVDSNTIRLPLMAAHVVESGPDSSAPTIGVAIGAQQLIFVRDDSATLAVLKAELRLAAAHSPQPVITLKPPAKTEASMVSTLFNLLKECGLKKIVVAPVPRE